METLEAIRTRRVAKFYDQYKQVADEALWQILQAGRWAPTAGNFRVHKFICINDRSLIRKIRIFFPGMVAGLPSALIFICINWELARYDCIDKKYNEAFYDIGHYSQNMLLAAHALGLVAGPMSSFSKDGLRVLLNMPEEIEPRFCIGIGYPADLPSNMPVWPKKKTSMKYLVQWGPYPG